MEVAEDSLAVPLDGRVLAFSLLAALFTSVLFGMLPAFTARGFDLRTAITNRQATSGDRLRLRQALIATEVALTIVLLAAAGLLSYWSVEQAVLPRVIDRLETHSRLLASDLESYVAGARGDIAGYRASTALNGLIRAHLAGGIDAQDGISEQAWRARIATRWLHCRRGARRQRA